MGGEESAVPTLFGKFAATLIGDGEPILLPPESSHVDAEAELAVVIGKPARRVSRERALGIVAGYVCANDVSARDLQYGDGQWFRGKNFETFCPVGPGEPVPVSELGDGAGLRVVQRLNGAILQDGSTAELIFDVPYLVAFASAVLTLEPGDLILTGTPAGIGATLDPRRWLRPGDEVRIEIDRIGAICNRVEAEAVE